MYRKIEKRNQKAYYDGHTKILVDIQQYFYDINIIDFNRFSVRSSISEL